MLGQYYIYRHIRPDTDQVFYVGVGRLRRGEGCYERSRSKDGRNTHWQRIVAKNNGKYEIEIMMHFDSREECRMKEVEFIALYGRADKRKGALANVTDGGDGNWGLVCTDEAKRLLSERFSGSGHPNWGKKLSAETCRKKSEALRGQRHHLFGTKLPTAWVEKIRQSKFGVRNPMYGKKGSQHPMSKPVVDTATGIVYESVTAAAIAVGMRMRTLHNRLTGHRINNTTLRFADNGIPVR